MVMSLTPALAPLLGGVASLFFLCQAIVAVLAVPGLIFTLLCLGLLGSAKAPEPSLPSLTSTSSSIGASLSNCLYLWYSGALALVWMSYFVFFGSISRFLRNQLWDYGNLLWSVDAMACSRVLVWKLFDKAHRQPDQICTYVDHGFRSGRLGGSLGGLGRSATSCVGRDCNLVYPIHWGGGDYPV